ncbi:heme/hemin ABC transporter substrate-binding protein [Pararhodonellum marinum]|uniref:heme/hemin ABC transporter substrate-binding protein n=1 Tax=Pararhodonellum marinum TaxID=2755358 RepID=UPI00188E792C|nr:ABC transporter substrate-binding protein [Pararhodonellum marinum]
MKIKGLLIFLGMLGACNSAVVEQQGGQRRLITAGGTITEIVYELGFGDQIIATDITSTYPKTMQELPSIGYRNQIKAEGILALGPDLLLAETGYLSDEVLTQLTATGLEIHLFDKPKNVSETYQLIHSLAKYLDVPDIGNQLSEMLKADMDKLEAFTAGFSVRPSMAFVMARGQETVFLAGEDTFADELIRLAGAQSTGKGFKDFIPLTPESLVSMDPEYLLFFDSGIASLGGKEGLKKIRGLESTSAFQKDRILAYDGLYLSGFGPRVGKAAYEIAKTISGS